MKNLGAYLIVALIVVGWAVVIYLFLSGKLAAV
jgi:hypothetical protein